MKISVWRLMRWFLVLLVAVVVAGVAIIATTDVEAYRGIVERQASDALDREVRITGEMDLALSLTPSLVLEGIEVGAPNSDPDSPERASIGRIEAQVQLLPLIGGEINVNRLAVFDADILLAPTRPSSVVNQGAGGQSADGGQAAPPPPAGEESAPLLPHLGRVALNNVTLGLDLDDARHSVTVERATLTTETLGGPIAFEIAAVWREQSVTADGRVDPPAAFLAGTPNWAFDVTAGVADAQVRVDGRLPDPTVPAAFQAVIDATVPDAAALAALAEVDLPALPALAANGDLASDGSGFSTDRLQLIAGESQVTVSGRLPNPIDPMGFSGTVEAEVPDLSVWSAVAQAALGELAPPLPPVAISAALAREGATIGIDRLNLGLAGASATVTGTIADVADPLGFDGTIAVQVPDTAAVGAATGMALPALPPLALQASLSNQAGAISLDPVQIGLGDSTLSGRVAVAQADRFTDVEASFEADRIDLTRLLDAFAVEESTDAGAPTGPLIPDLPLRPAGLDGVDVAISLTVAELLTPAGALGNVGLNAAVEGGDVSGDLALTGPRGGTVTASVSVAGEAPSTALTLSIRETNLSEWLAWMPVDGPIGADLTLQGSGPTTRAMLATSSGSLTATAGSAALAAPLLDWVGRGAVAALLQLDQMPSSLVLNCAAADFTIDAGTLHSNLLVADLPAATIAGDGAVELLAEQLDMVLKAENRQIDLLGLDVPVRIVGPLTAPQFEVMAANAIVGAGSALLLGQVDAGQMLVPMVATPAPGTGGNACAAAAADPQPSERRTQFEALNAGAIGEAVQDVIGVDPGSAADAAIGDALDAVEDALPESPLDDVGNALEGLFGN